VPAILILRRARRLLGVEQLIAPGWLGNAVTWAFALNVLISVSAVT
jgi:hypothetical protein